MVEPPAPIGAVELTPEDFSELCAFPKDPRVVGTGWLTPSEETLYVTEVDTGITDAIEVFEGYRLDGQLMRVEHLERHCLHAMESRPCCAEYCALYPELFRLYADSKVIRIFMNARTLCDYLESASAARVRASVLARTLIEDAQYCASFALKISKERVPPLGRCAKLAPRLITKEQRQLVAWMRARAEESSHAYPLACGEKIAEVPAEPEPEPSPCSRSEPEPSPCSRSEPEPSPCSRSEPEPSPCSRSYYVDFEKRRICTRLPCASRDVEIECHGGYIVGPAGAGKTRAVLCAIRLDHRLAQLMQPFDEELLCAGASLVVCHRVDVTHWAREAHSVGLRTFVIESIARLQSQTMQALLGADVVIINATVLSSHIAAERYAEWANSPNPRLHQVQHASEYFLRAGASVFASQMCNPYWVWWRNLVLDTELRNRHTHFAADKCWVLARTLPAQRESEVLKRLLRVRSSDALVKAVPHSVSVALGRAVRTLTPALRKLDHQRVKVQCGPRMRAALLETRTAKSAIQATLGFRQAQLVSVSRAQKYGRLHRDKELRFQRELDVLITEVEQELEHTRKRIAEEREERMGENAGEPHMSAALSALIEGQAQELERQLASFRQQRAQGLRGAHVMLAEIAQERTCIVCSEETPASAIVLWRCGHWLCARCTQTLIQGHAQARCPQCRSEMRWRDLTVLDETAVGEKCFNEKLDLLMDVIENRTPLGESVVVACKHSETAAQLCDALNTRLLSSAHPSWRAWPVYARDRERILQEKPKVLVVHKDVRIYGLEALSGHLVIAHAVSEKLRSEFISLLHNPAQRHSVFVTELLLQHSFEID